MLPSDCLLASRQFSAECNPPVPARKAMFMRSGFSGFACEQFHRHAPQWTHFSRSNAGTPVSPGVNRLAAARLDANPRAAFFAEFGMQENHVVRVAVRRLHLAAHEQRVLMRHEQLAVERNRGPAGLVHQRAVERNIFRFALVADLRDFFARNFAGEIIFHRWECVSTAGPARCRARIFRSSNRRAPCRSCRWPRLFENRRGIFRRRGLRLPPSLRGGV